MSVHAGSILTVGGNNVIDRIQSAGLGDVRVPVETIREVGNRLVVDKIPGEPDFTFTMETLDVSTDVMAWLCGKVGALASGSAPGNADPAGTAYSWADCGYVNVASPWKDPNTGSAGNIDAGHLVPAYYPTRVSYRYGVTDNAGMTVELGGGAFYYGAYTPIEEYGTGTGGQTAFVTSENAMGHRVGGGGGTTFLSVFGVIAGGTPMIEGADYTLSGGNGAPATITFTVAPAAGALVRFMYFSDAPHAYPQTVHAATIVKPGAVRGRHIPIYLGAGGARQRIASVQSFELEATVDSEVEREMGSELPTGRVINGRDCTGSLTVRSKDADAFIALLAKITGAPANEVFGFLNQNPIPLEVPILNPKDPSTVLKTLYVSDAIFQMPGTPARVNAPTDFTLQFDSQNGDYTEYKGAKP
jgi:hypothetical protein